VLVKASSLAGKNLEQVGSLERGKPSSALQSTLQARIGDGNSSSSKAKSGRDVKAFPRRREGKPGGGKPRRGSSRYGG